MKLIVFFIFFTIVSIDASKIEAKKKYKFSAIIIYKNQKAPFFFFCCHNDLKSVEITGKEDNQKEKQLMHYNYYAFYIGDSYKFIPSNPAPMPT